MFYLEGSKKLGDTETEWDVQALAASRWYCSGGENVSSGKKKVKFFFEVSKAPSPEVNSQKSEFIFMLRQ